jgi:hypothetical protein
MIAPTAHITPSENVFSREFDGEIVLLDLDSGVYYGLDAIASQAWKRLCDQQTTIQETAAQMLALYEVEEATLLSDLDKLVAEWIEKGLARVRS